VGSLYSNNELDQPFQHNTGLSRTDRRTDRHRAMANTALAQRRAGENHIQTSRIFLYMLTVAVAQSYSDDNAMRFILPVLWMTSCQWTMRHVAAAFRISAILQTRGRSFILHGISMENVFHRNEHIYSPTRQKDRQRDIYTVKDKSYNHHHVGRKMEKLCVNVFCAVDVMRGFIFLSLCLFNLFYFIYHLVMNKVAQNVND